MVQVFDQVLDPVLDPVRRAFSQWAERSQRDACRNAMTASSILAQRRRERAEVDEYLEAARHAAPAPGA